MYPDEPTKALAKGRAITTTHSNNGWTIRTTRAPILSVAKRSLAADSQVAWKRELGLGRATNQELPEALYGRNLLALRHDASGVRLAFDAREALARRVVAQREQVSPVEGFRQLLVRRAAEPELALPGHLAVGGEAPLRDAQDGGAGGADGPAVVRVCCCYCSAFG